MHPGTAAAAPEERTRGLPSVRAGAKNLDEPGACVAGVTPYNLDADSVSRCREGHKHDAALVASDAVASRREPVDLKLDFRASL
jgi:hypothetical protein